MAQALSALQAGDFEQAIVRFGEAIRLSDEAKDITGQAEALALRAEAYQALGLYPNALEDLQSALALSEKRDDRVRVAKILGSIGNVYLLAGAKDEAKRYLEDGIVSARKLDAPGIQAVVLNNLGNLLSIEEAHTAAISAYSESATLAAKTGNHQLAAKALTNAAGVAVEQNNAGKALEFLAQALQQLEGVNISHDKAYTLITIGQTYRRLSRIQYLPVAQTNAYKAYVDAAGIAEQLNDPRAASYSNGYKGQLYEDQKRYADALQITQQAVFAAQQANAPEILYLWQWQTARLLKALGDIDGAIDAYRQAVYSLQSLRHDLSLNLFGGRLSFRESVGVVYFELADMLLQRAVSPRGPENIERYLVEARDTVELLKAAELRDYFQDECVTALQSRITRIDRVAPHTAIVYPILFPDRTALLLSLPDGMKQVTVPVDNKTLTEEVRVLRKYLVKRTTREYLPHAQKLYDWLIRPLGGDLDAHKIDTLVFVPDGPLRTIPMAALHDGKQFLVQKYAIATTPGLSLTDARPLRLSSARLLLSGVTEPVRGFPGLPGVSSELREIHKLYGGKILRDREFLISSIEKELTSTPYSIVHIASHGQFNRDPRKTFLLTYDDELTMNELERFMQLSKYRTEPVELLTLSACQTAAGDDRSALGLAGVAVKAGARSALATLWFISDVSSSLLVSEFYRRLKQPSMSKAKALQQAQLKMISDRNYRHPGYWAPFLLIGNWL